MVHEALRKRLKYYMVDDLGMCFCCNIPKLKIDIPGPFIDPIPDTERLAYDYTVLIESLLYDPSKVDSLDFSSLTRIGDNIKSTVKNVTQAIDDVKNGKILEVLSKVILLDFSNYGVDNTKDFNNY